MKMIRNYASRITHHASRITALTLFAGCLGGLMPLVSNAQQDDLRENGPYDQRYFARSKGAAMQAPKQEAPPQPAVALQEDASGDINELIVLLEYGQTERLRTLLGAAGKAESAATPAGLERAVLAALTSKSSQELTTAFQAPVHARFLLDQERMGDADRVRGAKVKAPRERLERFMVLRYASVAAARSAAEGMKKEAGIASAQINRTGVISWAPNDPYFSSGGLPVTQYQWGLHAMNFPAAWDKARGQAQIGLVDYGYMGKYNASASAVTTHPELVSNSRPHFTPGAVAGVSIPARRILNDHAVHVGGIIAAQTNNGTFANPPSGGVAGACVGCSITIFPYSDNTAIAPGSASFATQLVAITKLVDGGMQMMNWSGTASARYACPSSINAICAVMEYAMEREVLSVISTGNFNFSETKLLSPLNFSSIYPVLPVGGTEVFNPIPSAVGSRWYYDAENGASVATNEGVVGPAKSIVSSINANSTYNNTSWVMCGDSSDTDESAGRYSNGLGDGIGSCTGTSMAAPYVSAMAGLIRSVNPRLTALQTRQIIQQSGNLASNRTVDLGYGLPNANLAVDAAIATNTTKLTPLFSFYSDTRSDSFYSTVPQMGNAALDGSLMPRQWLGASAPMGSHGVYWPTYGRNIFPYPYFPRFLDFVIGGTPDNTPKAEVWLFTTHINPKSSSVPLSAVYRMSWKCSDATSYPPALCASKPTSPHTSIRC